MKPDLQKQMQCVLDRLGVPLIVVWRPDSSLRVHGEIKGGIVFVYDDDKEEALATLTHEVIEFRLKRVTNVYRTMVNSLIEGYEKLAYHEKEEFIDFIPTLLEEGLLGKEKMAVKVE